MFDSNKSAQSPLLSKHEALFSETRRSEQFLVDYSRHIGPPMFCNSAGDDRGYHFTRPDARHFCLLKASKAIVSWKSAQVVALAGFHTEVVSLLRVSVEAATLTKWAAFSASQNVSGEYKAWVKKVVDGHFADYNRHPTELPAPLKVSITDVHRMLAETMSSDPSVVAALNGADPNELQKNVYVRFSKYVHAGYPETVDLYGAPIGELNLSGSFGSGIKDDESFRLIEAIQDTVITAIAHIPLVLDRACLKHLQPSTTAWLKRYR